MLKLRTLPFSRNPGPHFHSMLFFKTRQMISRVFSMFSVMEAGFLRAPFNLTASSQQNQIGRAELTDKSCSWQRCKLWTSVYVDNQG